MIFQSNTFMSKIEMKVLGVYLGFLCFILLLVLLTGCDSGWTIAGWEVK